MYRGAEGIDAINQLMQELLNPLQKGQNSFEASQFQYRSGDKVIHFGLTMQKSTFLTET